MDGNFYRALWRSGIICGSSTPYYDRGHSVLEAYTTLHKQFRIVVWIIPWPLCLLVVRQPPLWMASGIALFPAGMDPGHDSKIQTFQITILLCFCHHLVKGRRGYSFLDHYHLLSDRASKVSSFEQGGNSAKLGVSVHFHLRIDSFVVFG